MEILRCIGKENAEITETDFLKEMDLGLLEGMTWEERRQKYPEIDLEKESRTYQLVRLNDYSHLGELQIAGLSRILFLTSHYHHV